MDFTKSMGLQSATPLHFLAGSDSPYAYMMAQALLQKGADPNHCLEEGVNAGITPVIIAAAWGRLEMLKLLLMNGGDLGVTDRLGRSPREVAVAGGNTGVVKFIDWWTKGLNPATPDTATGDDAGLLPTILPTPKPGRPVQPPARNEQQFNRPFTLGNVTPPSRSFESWESPSHYVPRLFKSPLTPTGCSGGGDTNRSGFITKPQISSPKTPITEPNSGEEVRHRLLFNSSPRKKTGTDHVAASSHSLKFQLGAVGMPTDTACPRNQAPIRRLNYYESSPSLLSSRSNKHGNTPVRQEGNRNNWNGRRRSTNRELVDPEIEIISHTLAGVWKQSDAAACSLKPIPGASSAQRKQQSQYLRQVSARRPLKELNINGSPGCRSTRMEDANLYSDTDTVVLADSGVTDLLNQTLPLLDPSTDAHALKAEFESLIEDSLCVDEDDALWCYISTLPDSDLRSKLLANGITTGPITASTRDFYVKKLFSTLIEPGNPGNSGNKETRNLGTSKLFSNELMRALSKEFDTQLMDAERDEKSLAAQFGTNSPSSARIIAGKTGTVLQKPAWREGTAKMSFCYLLIDPGVLFANAAGSNSEMFKKLPESKQLDSFCHSIFYVGKGTKGRLYDHLKSALEFIDNNSSLDDIPNDRLRNIVEIWRRGSGVISLHVFHNIIPVDAYTREAAIIEALRLCNVCNLRKGDRYGLAKTWTSSRFRAFGVHLLRKAMRIMLADSIRPLTADDARK